MSTKRKRHIKYLTLILAPVLLIALAVLVPALSMGGTKKANLPGPTKMCAECHNDTTLITSKKTYWAESGHAKGEAVFYAGWRAGCSGCHSGGGFSDMIANGLSPDQYTTADPNPTRQECRTCHQIHMSYTGADWALETVAPVSLSATPGETFDGGKGNLCANCHQARRAFPGDPDGDGTVTGISAHWGPHHGPQSSMMVGTAGAAVADEYSIPAAHYSVVGDTCVGCHMGQTGVTGTFGVDVKPTGNHSLNPNLATCQTCHPGATSFDIGGVQSETQTRVDALGACLVAAGALSSNDENGHPTHTSEPENVAIALFNWIYIAHEDKSLGVHNPQYTDALLDASFAALGTCVDPAP